MTILEKLPKHKDIPTDFNAVIEIPKNGGVKYEIDKDSGVLIVDRILSTPMTYPADYGYIPYTLADDGDPLDVLVINDTTLMAGSMIRVRPVGVIIMEDEAGMDEKILCVPHSKVEKFYDDIQSYEDIPLAFRKKLTHFFEHYKDLEPNKWVKLSGWEGIEKAKEIILKSVKNYKS
ncbi:MAG: inorganic diphosphatase [Alphaproteobacteria bacterium]|nr:inorganic diphosphatase [Alphaproteobacteria bacterium]MBL0717644.1 inorganic diphosphatase [Alphaproteobacteria bacterium]